VAVAALAALAALCKAGAAEDECSAEAREAALDAASYARAGQEALVQRLSRPVKESLRGKLGQGVVLERWDGARGTAEEHASWMLLKTRELVAPDAPGFKPWGAHEGVTYEMHEALSAEAGGAGLFRLSGTIEIPPELATALLMHAGYLGLMDETVSCVASALRVASCASRVGRAQPAELTALARAGDQPRVPQDVRGPPHLALPLAGRAGLSLCVARRARCIELPQGQRWRLVAGGRLGAERDGIV
jgi:hypothetical protein